MNEDFEKKKNIQAGGYTLLSMVALGLILFLVSWSVPVKEEPLLDTGIEVNLGNSDFGLGDIPPMMPGDPAPEASESMASTPQSNPPAEELVSTLDENNSPDAIVVPKTVPKTVAKPKPTTNQTVSTTKPSVKPPAPVAPKPKATMGTYTGGKGTGGNNQDGFNNVRNQGTAGGTGDQGKSNGNINSDSYQGNGGTGKSGVSISRGLSHRSIVKFPSFEDDFNEPANVAIDIRIDNNGKVTSASFQAKNSTSGNANLKAIAIKKAKELKFNNGEGESIGTVIFKFRLKG